jgi:cobalamin biosynthesis protein CobD/CbiB
MDFSNRFRNTVGSSSNVADDKKRDDENVPWGLLITVMVILITFFIALPLMAFMYYDMVMATNAAVYEVKKMRQLRREILEERMYGR